MIAIKTIFNITRYKTMQTYKRPQNHALKVSPIKAHVGSVATLVPTKDVTVHWKATKARKAFTETLRG